METKNREKILFIAVAVGVGLLILNYLVYNPLAASWSSRQDNIKSLRAQISKERLSSPRNVRLTVDEIAARILLDEVRRQADDDELVERCEVNGCDGMCGNWHAW